MFVVMFLDGMRPRCGVGFVARLIAMLFLTMCLRRAGTLVFLLGRDFFDSA